MIPLKITFTSFYLFTACFFGYQMFVDGFRGEELIATIILLAFTVDGVLEIIYLIRHGED